MEITRFDYIQEAIDKGFIKAKTGIIEKYRGTNIIVEDVTPGNSCGYNYAIQVYIPSDGKYKSEKSMGEWIRLNGDGGYENFGYSEIISFNKEKNMINDDGCFSCMFSPKVYEKALKDAKNKIDNFRIIHPKLSIIERIENTGKLKEVMIELNRLRSIPFHKPIVDKFLTELCNNQIAEKYRLEGEPRKKIKEELLNGKKPVLIEEYLCSEDAFEKICNKL